MTAREVAIELKFLGERRGNRALIRMGTEINWWRSAHGRKARMKCQRGKDRGYSNPRRVDQFWLHFASGLIQLANLRDEKLDNLLTFCHKWKASGRCPARNKRK